MAAGEANLVERADELVPDGVTLTLSHEEAIVLADVLSRVAGSPTDSPRKHADTIYEGLRGAGYDWMDHDLKAFDGTAAIMYQDGEIA